MLKPTYYDGRVLRGSIGSNSLPLLKGTFEEKKARGKLRGTWINDLLQWTQKNKLKD